MAKDDLAKSWKNRKWLLSGDVPAELIAAARKVGEKEKRLRECLFADDLDEIISDAFARNLRDSYAIENERLNSSVIKSSIIRRLGLDLPAWNRTRSGEREAAAVSMTLSLLNRDPLTHEMLWEAHDSMGDILFRGRYRQGDEDEVIRSGSEIVYEAPPPYLVKGMMDDFVDWWNDDRLNLPPALGAAIGHYIFVVIHPFGDGNGRLARALAEKGMITDRASIFRPYSLSSMILKNRGAYYEALGSGNPLVFPAFMVGMHDMAVEDGMRKANALQFSRYYLKRADFSEGEKAAVRKMALEDRPFWLPDDFGDLEGGEEIFKRLKKRGVIDSSSGFNRSWRPGAKRPKP